jgi:hypothetical protein
MGTHLVLDIVVVVFSAVAVTACIKLVLQLLGLP